MTMMLIGRGVAGIGGAGLLTVGLDHLFILVFLSSHRSRTGRSDYSGRYEVAR
jgi:hypothetical protein